MQALEDTSLDFYTMLHSVVEQKRQAELQEALATSGWNTSRNSAAVASAPEGTFPWSVSSIGANGAGTLGQCPDFRAIKPSRKTRVRRRSGDE